MLIISLPFDAEARVLEMLKTLWVLPIDIRLAAHANRLRFRARSYSFIGSVPMLDILDRPITDWDSVAKRVFDIVFSLRRAGPHLADHAGGRRGGEGRRPPGPIIFRQKRHGFNNEEIDVYKFRSMYTGHVRSEGARAGDARAMPASRPSAGSSARPRSTSCRSSSTC